MASPAPKIAVVMKTSNQYSPRIDYNEKCTCGHYRYEHHTPFGCMQWDIRRRRGWCECEGFAPWQVLH